MNGVDERMWWSWRRGFKVTERKLLRFGFVRTTFWEDNLAIHNSPLPLTILAAASPGQLGSGEVGSRQWKHGRYVHVPRYNIQPGPPL